MALEKFFTRVIRVLNNEKGKVIEKKEALRWRRDYLSALREALRKFRIGVVRKLLLAVILEGKSGR
ncbi:MAG: hypothetical protein MjAS7_0966 [Metallosphaera javensis (ex Sakai et al. 2022)]|nr:MAG: hypothetical protein MjAS7_0966 [Metallosphaera javensis (ex Sakai et al. 2022)]